MWYYDWYYFDARTRSLLDVLLYDNFHVIYCGGLFFALRGNRVYLEDNKE